MLSGGLNANVVKTALDEVFWQGFDYDQLPGIATAETAAVFKQKMTDRSAVITEQHNGVGYFDSIAERESLPEATVRTGNQKTFSVVDYAKSLPISKDFYDDDLHGVWKDSMYDFGRKGKLSMAKNAFLLWNGSFDTYTSNDGSYIFADSHTTLNGGTVDNKLTSALAPAALETAYKMLVEQKTQDDTLGGHNPACLLVPPALFPKATEITKSELKADTAENNLNYWSMIYPGLMVMQSPFLSATHGGSDTAWFLLSDNHSMTRWVRQAIQTWLVEPQYQSNLDYLYKAQFREVVGAISWEGMVGSTGAGA